ncbi:efflux RND transporter periplasmic adaptor subunit [Psychrobacter sp. FDAARGOS_221]|uniref:efflux RND transporter periplasmic adaptor subunit n=1 Tax=Psychrobacter sp. FDAARGOS_221 TaxID=1975705 RepID=UPI000BB55E64|nr:hypothetical protein [Psychrobacter sp. FDAARGOS_221]PNK60739.1 hypothetical protein A6J60_007530 [Psychrobacter sp. FDAARGOS_221]
MLLPLTLVSHQQRASRSRLLRGLLIGMLSTSLVLTGCGSSANQVDPESGFVVLDDKVVVDNDLIHTSIPERYQPSYNLEGTLVPALTSDVSMPYDLISGSLMVKEGEQVEKGQVLAKIEAKIAEHELQKVAGEFVEVYVDGVQIQGASQSNNDQASDNQAGSNQAADDASQDAQSTGSATQNPGSQKPTASAKQPAPATSATDKSADTIKSANNSSDSTQSQQSQRMVTANLVIKSPITGEITQIDNANQLSSAVNTNTASKQSASSEKASNTSAKAPNAQETADQDTDAKDTAPDSDSASTATSNTDKQNQVSYPVIHIDSNHELQLTGELPITTQSQLSVGRPVSFTVYDLHTEFSGQVSHIIPDTTTNTLTVRASLIPGEDNDSERLKPGMGASMRIEYGQIELGVRLPREAIHEANLVELSAKHPRPTSPLKGYVWIVEQDQSLSYNPVQVVQYFEDSDKFLVSGINNDSLVCLADLPKTAAGKTLTVE